jgi:precorrin-2 dehydrogenase/sirohydrochlorin ferrochelatase
MPFYPIFLDITNKPCLVVGGGKVAERKVLSLLKAGADVTIISPGLTTELKDLVKKKKIRHVPKRYRPGDLAGYIKGAFLVISATNSEKINKKIHAEAEKTGKLVNVVDSPGLCNFIVPSVVERGNLKIAISTSGRFPMLAKTLRGNLEWSIPGEYETFVDILGAVRDKLLKEGVRYDKMIEIYQTLLSSLRLDWIKENSRHKINVLLKELLGKGYTLSKLGVKLKGKKAP